MTFTIEDSIENIINFLDVSIDARDTNFTTSVYRKETNDGRCLNGKSECPACYTDSVFKAYVHRALTHCSTWPLVHQELQRIQIIQYPSSNHHDLDIYIHSNISYMTGQNNRRSFRVGSKSLSFFYILK